MQLSLLSLCLVSHVRIVICGLYYKHITVVNYDSSVVNKCVASLSDDARVVIYDRHVFVVQATDCHYADCHYAGCRGAFFERV